MSNVTIVVPGVGPITLNLPNGPLPTIDPLTGQVWVQNSSSAGFNHDPQPGTYGNEQIAKS